MKRITAFLSMLLLMFGITALAQSKPVTISKSKVPLGTVLSDIERQTQYLFAYDVANIDVNRLVTIKVKDEPVKEVLSVLFAGTDVTYSVDGRNIMLTSKGAKKLSASPAEALNVIGTVLGTDKEPVIGATVKVAGTSTATATNIDGRFQIQAPEGSIVEITYIGCKPASFRVDAANLPVEVTMQEDASMLDEVVVVGYGQQKKVNLTGAVSVVGGDELQSRSANNMTQLLQGAVPNMNIRMTTGRPGDGGSINIRGVQTVSGSSNGINPLVLIDGVEGDINTVNPNDVESISVLKDASSAAVYGARGAFGVILVTTKRGSDSGRAHISYSGSYSFSRNTVSNDYETRGYYSAAINDMFYSGYAGMNYTTYNDEDYYELWIRRNDKTENPERPWVMVKDGQYKYYANFDWYNYFIDHSRPTWDHNLSISGGNENVRYWLSGGYHKQEGIIRLSDDNFEKFNFRSKVEIKLASFLTVSNNTSYYRDAYAYKGFGSIRSILGVYNKHNLASITPRNPDGTLVYNTSASSYGVTDGVSAALENGKHRNADSSGTFQTTFEARVTPLRQVELVGNYTYLDYNLDQQNRFTNVQYSRVPGEVITLDTDWFVNKLYDKKTGSKYHSFNIYGSFSDTYAGAHNVKATAGVNYETRKWNYLAVERDGLNSDELDDFNLATGDIMSIIGGMNQYKLFGVFYRVNYDYKGRYLLETGGRYDGSSRFKNGSRYGFFPSVSAGWRISEEPFFNSARTYVDNLKIRVSYGQLGNQQSVGYYDYIQTISTAGKLGYAMGGDSKLDQAYVSAPNADDLTWEKVITKNIGLDLGLFNNRLSLTADLYQRDTKDILTNGMDLPSVYGTSIPMMNAADIRTQGWELTVGWMDQFQLAGRTFSYSATAGIGDNTARVRHFNNPNKLIGTPYEGQKLGDIWGYVVNGYFRTDEEAFNYDVDCSQVNGIINVSAKDPGLHAGDLKFEDLDGDGVIQPTLSADKPRDQKVIGNSMPRYTYSLRLTADYAGVDFSALIQGVGHQDWYAGIESWQYWGPYTRPYQGFIPSDFLSNVWSEDNPDALYPRPRGYVALGTNRELGAVNTRYLENVAYCRLKNLTVGYTLPRKWLNAIHMEKVRVYFSGDNLLTFTPFRCKYLDPEQAGAQNTWRYGQTDVANVYPNNKQFTFGVDVTF